MAFAEDVGEHPIVRQLELRGNAHPGHGYTGDCFGVDLSGSEGDTSKERTDGCQNPGAHLIAEDHVEVAVLLGPFFLGIELFERPGCSLNVYGRGGENLGERVVPRSAHRNRSRRKRGPDAEVGPFLEAIWRIPYWSRGA